ncbi:MAG: hypothetical protein JW915_19010 [Chitinispirillaceae bacterium]|nr:hypothetical protein [Chitinispirillaceae bacterium]
MKNGEILSCTKFELKLTPEKRFYLCDGVTIYPEKIKSIQNSDGYFIYFDYSFLKRECVGKLSLYSGEKKSLDYETIDNGMREYPAFDYVENTTRVNYYTFDDSLFFRYYNLGPNEELTGSLKSNPASFRYYKAAVTVKWLSGISQLGFVLPVILGFDKLVDKKKSIPLLVIGCSGLVTSSVISSKIPNNLFSKAVATYNLK